MIQSSVKALAISLTLLALGCHGNNLTNVIVDLPPHRVEGVYSVTGDREVTIYWRLNQESDIDHYKVYRNLSPTGTFSLVGTTSQNQLTDTNVSNGVTYYYAVAAVDLAGQESAELSVENVFDTPRPEGFGVRITNTFSTDATSGWDFSASARRSSLDPLTDVYYGASGGHYIIYAATGTEIQDDGYVALRDVDFAPPAGWSADGQVEAIPGHSYIVLTIENHYAKFEVVSRDNSMIVMDWAYQIDAGNPELTRRAP